jgi:hypothetical protein
MKQSLDDIALKYGTDKSSEGHNYTPLYEKHLPEKVGKFLEIGVWEGAGIRMFREWYNEQGMFYALDRFIDGYGLITVSQLQAYGINAFIGSQDDLWFLETIKEQFSVISEDCSHHWDSQINTFKMMFVNNIEPGGLYVCEDIFDDTIWGRNVVLDCKDNLRHILIKYKETGSLVSRMVTQKESDTITSLIEEAHVYDKIVFVKRKNNA